MGRKKEGDRNQLFPTNKFRVFDSLGLPQTVVVLSVGVVVIVVVVLVQTARSGQRGAVRGRGRREEADGASASGSLPRELGPFVGSNSVRLSGMPLCQCSQLSLSLSVSPVSPSHSLPYCPSLSANVAPSLSVLRLLPLPHVALSKDSCSYVYTEKKCYFFAVPAKCIYCCIIIIKYRVEKRAYIYFTAM